jgi:hypothetical protein
LTSKFHLEYLHVEGYAWEEGGRKVTWMPIRDGLRRDELARREADLRRAAERERVVGPLRRRARRRDNEGRG